ncbi:hypothetical protein EJB05_10308, partial [Eragrostis curvula]
MLDVMMMSVLVKSTALPLPSVSRPSSNTCSMTLNTSNRITVFSAKHDALTFPRVLSVVPRVWRRLAATFLAAFGLLFAYHVAFILLFIALLVMRKSKDLIHGKLPTAAAIFFTLNVIFAVVEVAFRAWVVRGAAHGIGGGTRFLLGLLMLAALCAVVMLALVTQTIVYLVCKSYHHESIDKANISDHLEVYLGDYVPLKASDVQMEQFQVILKKMQRNL